MNAVRNELEKKRVLDTHNLAVVICRRGGLPDELTLKVLRYTLRDYPWSSFFEK